MGHSLGQSTLFSVKSIENYGGRWARKALGRREFDIWNAVCITNMKEVGCSEFPFLDFLDRDACSMLEYQ
jgi:hypothetical protein